MSDKRESLEETLNALGSSDLIPHDKLIEIAFRAWHQMPVADRAGKQAVEKWKLAIYTVCKPSVDAAAAALKERNGDEPALLGTQLMLLKDAFIRQVDRAMRDLSERDQHRRNQVKAMASINAMIKEIDKG